VVDADSEPGYSQGLDVAHNLLWRARAAGDHMDLRWTHPADHLHVSHAVDLGQLLLEPYECHRILHPKVFHPISTLFAALQASR
jgi:hypothetical protein